MAWFWFIIAAILLVNEFRLGFRLSLFQRNNEALINSLAAIIIESGVKPEKAAITYLDNLSTTLLVEDYSRFMKDLCAKNGLNYQTDGEYLIHDELKVELARRIGQHFIESQKIVEAGR